MKHSTNIPSEPGQQGPGARQTARKGRKFGAAGPECQTARENRPRGRQTARRAIPGPVQNRPERPEPGKPARKRNARQVNAHIRRVYAIEIARYDWLQLQTVAVAVLWLGRPAGYRKLIQAADICGLYGPAAVGFEQLVSAPVVEHASV